MKKLVSLALSAVLALSVVACGSSDTAASTTESTSESSDATASADGAFKIGGIGPITGGAAIYGLPSGILSGSASARAASTPPSARSGAKSLLMIHHLPGCRTGCGFQEVSCCSHEGKHL